MYLPYVVLVHDVLESYFFMIGIGADYLAVCEKFIIEHPDGS